MATNARIGVRSWSIAILPLAKGRTSARALCFVSRDANFSAHRRLERGDRVGIVRETVGLILPE